MKPILPRDDLPRRGATRHDGHDGGRHPAHIALVLVPSLLLLLLLYAMSHSQAALEAGQLAARELNHDHLLPTRDLCRALSLVRALRNRQSPEADIVYVSAALTGHALVGSLGGLPRRGLVLIARITSPLTARLPPLMALMGWLH
jgi:hypothetical protein